MTDLEKDREDRSKRIMDRRVLQVTTLQELGEISLNVIQHFLTASLSQQSQLVQGNNKTTKNGLED